MRVAAPEEGAGDDTAKTPSRDLASE